MSRLSGVVTRGGVAGLLAGATVAFWFLLVDASRAQPLQTPAFLAAAVFGLEGGGSAASLALYTVSHLGAFVAIGILLSWVFARFHATSGILLGVIVGFALFDLVFYTSEPVTGVDVVAALGWPEVLVATLLAGVVMMGFLQVSGDARTARWLRGLVARGVVRDGLGAGLLGAAALALWFAVADVAQGQPFLTPGALGSALFLGADSPAQVVVGPGTVAAYTVVHVLAFLAAGWVAAALAAQARETPALLPVAGLIFLALEILFLGAAAVLATFVLGPLAWWSVALGNLVAAAAMGAFLWTRARNRAPAPTTPPGPPGESPGRSA